MNAKLLVMAVTLMLTGCVTTPTLKQSETKVILSAEESQSVALLETVKSEAFGWSQWKIYENVEGYKAFAVAEDDTGHWRAVGWSEDMISRYWAVRAAMYVCRYYANDWPCRVVDVRGPSKEVVLGPDILDAIPEHIIRYQSVADYRRFEHADGPRALAMRMPSGIVIWHEANTKAEAEKQAMDQCWEELHESENHCELVASHD